MEPIITQLHNTIEEQSKKINAIQESLEKIRKYFLVTAWITALAVILPLLGLLVIGSSFVTTYTGKVQDLGD
jgi:uncharacterized membrane protein YjjP (DUF1212 family)